ncbi:hypothetical protein M1329_01475 [Candidatus Marsarchaeota archaeon]|jgi:hypothetical protein|nr:hypothetical protein [Candidatus Marsarchaeota archaeon]MCL5100220.1 hypothetical protein [Candidatus Marsarchaeota archaeon]
MKYNARVSKRLKYVRVYAITKRLGNKTNPLAGLFIKIFNRGNGEGSP